MATVAHLDFHSGRDIMMAYWVGARTWRKPNCVEFSQDVARDLRR